MTAMTATTYTVNQGPNRAAEKPCRASWHGALGRGQRPRITQAAKALTFGLTLLLLPCGVVAQESPAYERIATGTRILESASGLSIKVLVEESVLGSSDVEIAEITFPANSPGGDHRHAPIEIFYVLSGKMGHVVNGERHVIEPGQVAIVRPGDTVSHEVLTDEPVKALVIWAPGGEVEQLANFFDERPVEP